MSTGCFLPYVGLGSCLLHMNFVHEFAKKEGPITILTFSKSLKDALQDDPNIKETILIQKFHKKIFDIFKLSQFLKNLNLRKIYIFKCSLRFYFAAKWAGIDAFSYPFYKKSELHLIKQAHDFTKKNLGIQNCSTEPKLYVDQKKIQEVKKFIPQGKKNILIAPSSSGPTTMWGENFFIDVMKRLDSKFDCFFIIAVDSTEKEKKIADKIISNFDKNKIISLSDKTINQAMPIIACCNLSISNDTSFQHLSCQLNVPVLILRLDTPDAYSSYSKFQYSVFPAGYSEVTHNTRADPNLISTDKVFKKALDFLN